MDSSRAYLIREVDGRTASGFVTMDESQLDSVYAGEPSRSRVWHRLTNDLRARHLEIMSTIAFEELPQVFDAFVQGQSHGRVVVEVGGNGMAQH